MADAIAELARVTLVRDFCRINLCNSRIILIEAGPRVLSAFPEQLSAKAQASLEGLGVEVQTHTTVEDMGDDFVIANGERIGAATKIWAAGVQVEHLADWLGVETDRIGRVSVAPDLTVPGLPSVSVVGDAAKVTWTGGKDVPGIAPAAKQMGHS